MGRSAYCGPAGELRTFFEGLGKPLPSNANPAEFVLDCVSADMSSKEEVTSVLDAWASKAPKVGVPTRGALERPPPTAGLCLQTWILFQRTLALALRDPVLYVSRMVLIPVLICMFGLIYIESRDATQSQVMPRFFLLNWVCTMPSILNLIVVLALNQEYTNARAEMKSGAYSPFAYIVATTLVQGPMMFVLSICALVPGYAVGNWPWEGFVTMVIIYACNMWCFETMAQLFSLGANAIFGMFNYIQIWSIALMFNGVVFRGKDVVGILRWMYFGFPLKWFMNALCYTVFEAEIFTGTANCNYTSNMDDYMLSMQTDPTNPVALVYTSVEDGSTMGVQEYSTMMVKSLGCFRGFYCPNASDPLQCFGPTGQRILDTLNVNYESISGKDDRVLDVTVMLILAGAFKVMFIIFVCVDIYSRVMIREWLNLNSPNLIIVSCIIVTFIALGISGEEYGPAWL